MKEKCFKVVMTDYDFPSLENETRIFDEIGAEFVPAQCKTAEEVIALCKDADGIINEYYRPLDSEFLSSLEKCRVIGRTGIGVDTIDVEAATENGIAVVNVPAYCLDEVSDHALMFLLACSRKLTLLNDTVKSGSWDWHVAKPIERLRGKTLGILGYGKIARRLRPKAQALGLKVIACDPLLDRFVPLSDMVPLVTLEELLERSDFISIHTPLTELTEGLFDEEILRKMKPTAFLINTARGPIVSIPALYRALSEGWIAGAALDVQEVEPVQEDNPLLGLDNVILTPHCAWYSEEALNDLQATTAEEVARVLMGKMPLSLVNPDVLEKLQLE